LIPTRIGSAIDWVAVEAGSSHSLAQKADGTLWAWGNNNKGPLGQRDTLDRYTPVQVSGFPLTVTRTITASAGTGGSISPSGAVPVADGADQTFTITPDPGYRIMEVLIDGVPYGTISSYTFTGVTSDHTIQASFTNAANFVICATAGSGGAISPGTAVAVPPEGSQTYSIIPDSLMYCRILDVVVDGVSMGPSISNYTFSYVYSDHTITAFFTANYNYVLWATCSSGGAISPYGGVAAPYGTDQTFTFFPETGYRLADVLVDGISVGLVDSYTFTYVFTDHSIIAVFAPDGHTITASAGYGGTILPSGGVTVTGGADQTFDITPWPGYHILDVTLDGVSLGPVTSYTIQNVTADHTIQASFIINTYTITVSAGPGGTISPPGPVTVTWGAYQTFIITPNPGYHTVSVILNGVDLGPVQTVGSNFYSDHTISATFAIDTHTIAATAGANGSITPSGSVTVNHGASQTFAIAPNPGYHIADVLVDGASVGPVASYTFTNVIANHTISATFAIDTHTIAATAGAGGTISPSGMVQVIHGGSQNFSIKANTNYVVKDVRVDGISVGPVASYTFTSVITDHTISASFIADKTRIITDRNRVRVPPLRSSTFQVKLSDDPGKEVMVSVTRQSGNRNVIIKEGTTLVFNQDNWDTYQTVTLVASNNYPADPPEATIQISCTDMDTVQVKASLGYQDISPVFNLLLRDDE
jgi:hypothetical protein